MVGRVPEDFVNMLEVVGDFLGGLAAAECGYDGFPFEGVEDGPGGLLPEALVLFDPLFFGTAVGLDLQVEALEGGAGGEAVALAQGVQLAEGLAEVSPVFLGIGCGIEETAGCAGELRGEDGGEAVGNLVMIGGIVEVVGGFDDVADEAAGVLAALPVEEAASFPCGEIWGVDGAALEIAGEEGLDFGEPVEPADEVCGLLAIIEAGVESVTDVAGQACDFAGARHR